ncbi:MAG: DUF1800 domain-containing protein [bacterium]|nr:DUF1800 domain-containing protein [bacterium]
MTRTATLALAVTGLCTFASPIVAQGTPDPLFDYAHHVARRVAYGPTNALITTLTSSPTGPDDYITAQLSPPNKATSTAVQYHGGQLIADLVNTAGPLLPQQLGDPVTALDLFYAQLGYAMFSEWQLRELMTQFWERHFNTGLYTRAPYFNQGSAIADNNYVFWFEWQANEYYREHGLGGDGTFYGLLRYTAKHATMMVYLNTVYNKVINPGDTPNEDWARECLELYTVSPEHRDANGNWVPNYSQADIEEASRMFTGWDLDPAASYAFEFNTNEHAYPSSGQPTVLLTDSGLPISIAAPIAPAGLQEGEDLLVELAKHPATAQFICRKLIAEFVNEQTVFSPTSTLLNDMMAVWGTAGDIPAVMGVLLSSPDFKRARTRFTRARLPLQAVAATARAFDSTMEYSGLYPVAENLNAPYWAMESMGHRLLLYPAPNGFPTSNDAQMSPSVALERAYYASNLISGDFPVPFMTDTLEINLEQFVASVQPQLPGSPTMANSVPHLLAVVDHMLTSLYGSNYTLADELRVLDAMLGVVNHIGPTFDIANNDDYKAVLEGAAIMAAGMVQSGLR